jgi:hypothetical protein
MEQRYNEKGKGNGSLVRWCELDDRSASTHIVWQVLSYKNIIIRNQK